MKKSNNSISKEIALSKKRKIYGIDPCNYETKEEFYEAVNQEICEVCNKKIENIQRHIKACGEKYKKLLLDLDHYMIQVPLEYQHLIIVLFI